MMLHALDFLVRLVSFSSHQNHITRLRHHHGRPDGLTAVGNTNHLGALLIVESGQHILNNGLRFLKAWIIAGDDYAVAEISCFASHQRTLALVTIAAGAAYGDDVPFLTNDFADGLKHILQSIGRMGIIHNGTKAFG